MNYSIFDQEEAFAISSIVVIINKYKIV